MIYFSATTGGFHHESNHGPRRLFDDAGEDIGPNPECLIPADAVEVSAEDHRALMDAQSRGFEIKADRKGLPIASPIAPPSSERLWGTVRAARNRRLAASDWTQLGDVPPALKGKWAARRQFLRDIPQTQKDPTKIDWGADPV